MDWHSRRRFLKCAAASGLLYAFGRTPGAILAHAAGIGGFANYRALVCVFLYGGNDSWNMVVPRSAPEYDAYASARRNLAMSRDALLPIAPSSGGDYGMHPSMSGIADLFESGRLAVIPNVGPLIKPTTLEQYRNKTVPIPPQLFSHNDQQHQWQTLRGQAPSRTGWAGRIADLLSAQFGGQQLALNASLSGASALQAGTSASPFIMGASGPVIPKAFGVTGLAAQRRAAFERIMAAEQSSVYEREFAEVHQRAISNAERVNAALAGAPSLATAFPAGSALATQLKTVARLVAVRDALNMSRQIFFVATGGYDTHNAQAQDQPRLFGDLSASLAAFQSALDELGVADAVTTFTNSDFGRTLSSNGDGSDHAWGGAQIVMGGSVTGRAFYGDYPVLRIGGDLDVGGGRLIPTVSADQLVATLVRWFGVTEEQIPSVAPSIGNFAERDLGFMS
jgi:uncharacterized protein (DUF1501 family)